jgi:hypothetical protein
MTTLLYCGHCGEVLVEDKGVSLCIDGQLWAIYHPKCVKAARAEPNGQVMKRRVPQHQVGG